MAKTDTNDFSTLISESQKQAISSLRQAQDLWLQATRAATGIVPGDPSLAGTVPSPREAVEASFGFAEQVLELQKNYALQVADILSDSSTKIASGARKATAEATKSSS